MFGKNIRKNWLLEEDVIFINHGSFGATPIPVLEACKNYMEQMERQPLRFFLDEYPELIRKSVRKLAEFINAKSENIGLVENSTTGINTVLKKLCPQIQPGDELLTTSHVYSAIRNAMKYTAEGLKAKYVEIELPFPLESEEQIIETYKKGFNDNTRLVVIDHIASSSAVIFPVKKIVELAKQFGVLTIIDGAHAPGMLEFNIKDINPDFYIGNCHKWLMAPKGSAFLWASNAQTKQIHPLVISLFYQQGFTSEFDYQGTKNPVSWLALSDAIDFYSKQGKKEVMKHNHELAISAAKLISKELNLEIPAPEYMFGSMVTFEYKGKVDKIDHNTFLELRNKLYKNYKIEMPFFVLNNKVWFRISAQIYNEISDYEILCTALKKMLV
ncbi:MAG: aminotransferase class V-fold PLP-dependent enzyme [Bacteroidota bacterium]